MLKKRKRERERKEGNHIGTRRKQGSIFFITHEREKILTYGSKSRGHKKKFNKFAYIKFLQIYFHTAKHIKKDK